MCHGKSSFCDFDKCLDDIFLLVPKFLVLWPGDLDSGVMSWGDKIIERWDGQRLEGLADVLSSECLV